MHRYIFVILFIGSFVTAEELYYYAGGTKIYLFTYNDRISVTWQKDVTTGDKDIILHSKPEIKAWYHLEKYPVTILAVDITKAQTLLAELRSLPQVEFISFLLHTGQNDSLILTNELIVKLMSVKLIEGIKSQYQVELLREDPFDDGYLVLRVLKNSQFNALEVANRLTEAGKVIYACPNFIARIEMQKVPNDDYYPAQWSLPKIGVPLAWDYETGSSSIKIAIFDTGVDLGHPDLRNVIVTGYDAVDGDTVPQDDHGHGTCCAGIAAAITNNDEGVAGIGGGWGISGALHQKVVYEYNHLNSFVNGKIC